MVLGLPVRACVPACLRAYVPSALSVVSCGFSSPLIGDRTGAGGGERLRHRSLQIARRPGGGHPGEAQVFQRAAVALLLLIDSRWRDPGGDQLVQPLGSLSGQLAQAGIETHIQPPARLPVKQRPRRHGGAQHLLQAHRLRAELHPIRVVALGLAAFVLHGERHAVPGAELRVLSAEGRRRRPELDHVGFAEQPELARPHRRSALRAATVAALRPPGVGPLVQVPALDGELVLRPEPLDMNQRALPRAIQQMLQGGDGEKLIVEPRHGKI